MTNTPETTTKTHADYLADYGVTDPSEAPIVHLIDATMEWLQEEKGYSFEDAMERAERIWL